MFIQTNAQPFGVLQDIFDADPAFWAKVDIKGPDDCWLFNGFINSDGYGVYRGTGSHRRALALATGGVKPGLNALHTCHCRRCNNPKHLYWGDQQQNAMDRVNAGRMPPVIRKLDEDHVRTIRRMNGNGVRQKTIAVWFGITEHHVRSICNFNKWRSVAIAA